jgi:hypothetical protein
MTAFRMLSIKMNNAIIISLISAVTSLASLSVSILSYLETQKNNEFQRNLVYSIDADIDRSMPLQVYKEKTEIPASIVYKDIEDPAIKLGMVSFWVQVQITNTGTRPFSIEDASTVILQGPNNSETMMSDMRFELYANKEARLTLPRVVESGRQERFYLKVSWPTTVDVTSAIASDYGSKEESFGYVYLHSLGKRELSLTHTSSTLKDNILTVIPNKNVSLGIKIKITGRDYTDVRRVMVY